MFSPKVLDRAHVLEVRALTPRQYVSGTGEGPAIDLARRRRSSGCSCRHCIKKGEQEREPEGNSGCQYLP